IDRVAGLYVTGDNAILLAAAGRDFNLNAAAVYNGGDGGVTVLQAGRDLTLGTVTETLDSYAHTQTSWRKENATTQVGSLVQAQGDILLLAGNDLTARGATVASQEGALAALAGGDIALATATNTHNVSQPGIGTGVPIATYVMNPLEVLRHQRFSGTAKPPGRAAVSPRLA
ncbi:MAG: hemagglutinin repeat-containing protein, partial [Betaproteobacteria bacterium]|nr:hemagglutinin repeat-containing protein [Betaproteobacteria bacterium]